MGYWWLLLATFIHVNVVLILIAMLPYPTPRQWKWILEFRVLRFFIDILNIDLWKTYLVMACLCFILFLDAVRSYYSLSMIDFQFIGDPLAKREARVALAEAQRNYFIAGGAFCISIFFPRLIQILKDNVNLGEKRDTLATAVKVFQSLINMMRIERNIEENGGLELSIVEAMQYELKDLDKEKPTRLGDPPRLNDIRKILEIYERREERVSSSGSGQPVAGGQQPMSRLTRAGNFHQQSQQAEDIAAAFLHQPPQPPAAARHRRTPYLPHSQKTWPQRQYRYIGNVESD